MFVFSEELFEGVCEGFGDTSEQKISTKNSEEQFI